MWFPILGAPKQPLLFCPENKSHLLGLYQVHPHDRPQSAGRRELVTWRRGNRTWPMASQSISNTIYVNNTGKQPFAIRLPTKEEGERGLAHPQGAPRGLLLHYMLRKISKNPCHGYEILQEIDAKTEGAWRPGAGSIYPILKKLLENGYIQSDQKTGADRRIYSIT